MGFFDKVKAMVQDDVEDEVETNKATTHASANPSMLILFEPRSYDQIYEMAEKLTNKRAIVVNLCKIDKSSAQRIIDFLSGTVYALNGSVKQAGDEVFVFAPNNLPIDGEIDLNS